MTDTSTLRHSITKPTPAKPANYSGGVIDPNNKQTIDFYSRKGSIFEGNTSMASEESFAGSSFDDLSAPHFQGKKKITNSNAKFVDKKAWKNNPECNVCERKLDKMKGVNTHHCRLCASAVCGTCSNGKVNGERVCDICFFKQKTEMHEKRREDFLALRIERIAQAEMVLQSKHEELVAAKEQMLKARAQVDNSNQARDSGLGKLENSQEEEAIALRKLKQANDVLRHDIEKIKREARDKEENLKNLRTKISALKLQVNQKKALISDKTEQLKNLAETKKALEARRQIANISVSQNLESVENRTSSTPIKRHYTMTPQGQDRKYSISTQPVNI